MHAGTIDTDIGDQVLVARTRLDRRQPQMLMPVKGGQEKKPVKTAKPAPAVTAPAGRRKKAG